MKIIWVVELSYDKTTWVPTVTVGTTGKEATMRKQQLESQAKFYKSDPCPFYRVRRYVSKHNKRS